MHGRFVLVAVLGTKNTSRQTTKHDIFLAVASIALFVFNPAVAIYPTRAKHGTLRYLLLLTQA